MDDQPHDIPPLVAEAQALAKAENDEMSSGPRTGALLRTLAASKPGGLVLEVGTGLGVGAAWLLAGMDSASRLVTLEVHEGAADLSRSLLARDDRCEVVTTRAEEWLEEYSGPPFDLVFVDTTIVKFHRRDLVIRSLAPGGLFVADDLVPQPKWVDTHQERVRGFLTDIWDEKDLIVTLMDWDTGLCVAARRTDQP